MVADVATVIPFNLSDAGVVVHRDDADWNIVLDLAHHTTVAQTVDRDIRRIAEPLPIAQAALSDDFFEGSVVVRVLPCPAAPFATDRFHQQRRGRRPAGKSGL